MFLNGTWPSHRTVLPGSSPARLRNWMCSNSTRRIFPEAWICSRHLKQCIYKYISSRSLLVYELQKMQKPHLNKNKQPFEQTLGRGGLTKASRRFFSANCLARGLKNPASERWVPWWWNSDWLSRSALRRWSLFGWSFAYTIVLITQLPSKSTNRYWLIYIYIYLAGT